jgi:hypothetical protein
MDVQIQPANIKKYLVFIEKKKEQLEDILYNDFEVHPMNAKMIRGEINALTRLESILKKALSYLEEEEKEDMPILLKQANEIAKIWL